MTDNPIIAPAYPDITEGDVRTALEQADIRSLAAALVPGAFLGDWAPDKFRCPDCGAGPAVIIDNFRWQCLWCPESRPTTTAGQRTKFGLRARVADDFQACLRLVRDVIDQRPFPDKPQRSKRALQGGKVLT